MKREFESRGFRYVTAWTRGIDTTLFAHDDPTTLDLPRPIFCTVGRISREKNLDAFFSARLPGTKLVIGDGRRCLTSGGNIRTPCSLDTSMGAVMIEAAATQALDSEQNACRAYAEQFLHHLQLIR